MRSVRLAEVAARSEVLRLRLYANRTATRLVVGLVAAVFVVAVLVDGHIALALWLTPRVGPLEAVGLVAAADGAIAIVLALIAGLRGPGRAEREALEVRELARHRAMEALTVTAILGTVTSALGPRRIAGILRFGARALGGGR